MATQIQPPVVEREKIDDSVDTSQTITLSRRVVYFQAALLGVIATTFFVFGMMVGTLTSGRSLDQEILDCAVTGRVLWEGEPDRGAVVYILPLGKTTESRLNPRSLHPDAFDAVENEVIEMIVGMGGAVVRTDRNGEFDVDVDSPARYSVVVVSKNSPSSAQLGKKQMAALSTFFMPVNELREDKSVYVQAIQLNSTKKNLGNIEFN